MVVKIAPRIFESISQHAFRTHSRLATIFSFTQRQHFPLLIAAHLISCLCGLIKPAISILIGRFFTTFSEIATTTTDTNDVSKRNSINIGLLLALAASTLVIKAAFSSIWEVHAEVQLKVVQQKLFANLLERNLEWFDKQHSDMGSLLIGNQTDIDQFQQGTSKPVGHILAAFVQILSALIIAFVHSWNLALVILATLPVLAAIISLLGTGSQKRIDDQDAQLKQATRQASHTLHNILFITTSNMRKAEIQRYILILHDLSKRFRRHILTLSVQEGISKFASTATIVLSLFYGTHLVRSASISPGTIVTTFQCCAIVSSSFNDILAQLLQLQKGYAASLKLNSVLYRMRKGEKTRDQATGRTPVTVEGDIEFRSVSFAFPSSPETIVLRDVSMFFPAHETTFVVGKSGSGKSTLASLLVSFYSPNQGEIYLDGWDISKLESQWLRNNVTLVQQDPFLFKDTIANNIEVSIRGRDHPAKVSTQSCVAFAALQDTIEDLPAGLDTFVGTGGASLSGGQKQRITLARARLRDTPILVLDEATSALDEISKCTIMRNLREWRQDKTTLIITHDLSQIVAGDYVYVMDDGKVIADGYYADIRAIVKAALSQPSSEDVQVVIDEQSITPSCETASIKRTRPGLRRQYSHASTISQDLEGFERSHAFCVIPQTDLLLPTDFRDSREKTRSQILTRLYKRNRKNRRAAQQEIGALGSESLQVDSYELVAASRSRRLGKRLTMMTTYQRVGQYPHLPATNTIQQQANHFLDTPSEDEIWREATRAMLSHPQPPLPSPDPARPKRIGLREILSTMLTLLALRDKLLLSMALLLNSISATLPAVSSLVMVKLFTVLYSPENWRHLSKKWSAILAAIAIADGILMFGVHRLFLTRAEAWSFALRVKTFRTIVFQPRSWFDRPEYSADEMGQFLDTGPNETSVLLNGLVRPAETIVVMLTLALVISFVQAWKLALIVIAHGILFIVIGKISSWTCARWEDRKFKASERVAEVFSETFSDIRTVRALSLQSSFHKKYLVMVSNAFRIGRKRAIYTGICYGLSECGVVLVTASIFNVAFQFAYAKKLETENILAVLSVLLLTLLNVSVISSLIPATSTGMAAGKRVLEVLQLKTDTSADPGTDIQDPNFDATIVLKFLTFRYPERPETAALQSLSLNIPKGQCISITGPSGSGKSTILSLLLGLYPVTQGTFTVSGHDITQIDLVSLRSKIAYVPQHPVMFSMSVRANITYGLDEASIGEQTLVSAARAAGIHDFIDSLPAGYDTIIGDAGQGVSGGQAQRIALARAFARRAKIMALDEPTSALDPQSAAIIKQSIRSLSQVEEPPTIIIVTHARDVMQITDRTVVLDRGRIVEDGNYADLYDRGGVLWSLLNGTTSGLDANVDSVASMSI